MSAREHILPVFVPHFGCPHDCVFCNQRHISGEQIPATAETVRRVILEAGQRTDKHEKLQLAFYGGSFTAIPEEDQLFLLQAAREALDFLDVDPMGLDNLDREILSTMIGKFQGGPVGLDTLAAAIGEDSGTIEDVYEPYLIKNGFLVRTPKGRAVTDHAYLHLGLTLPERAGV